MVGLSILRSHRLGAERDPEGVDLATGVAPWQDDADLKARRELRAAVASRSGALEVVWFDQAVVRAALAGRVLIIEGLEKAERNVLPILNNLLENREMQLEDGRFLVAPQRYDRLVKEGKDTGQLNLVRVHEHFRATRRTTKHILGSCSSKFLVGVFHGFLVGSEESPPVGQTESGLLNGAMAKLVAQILPLEAEEAMEIHQLLPEPMLG
eukprot:Skav209670  [mRNA]  locus=scaffold2126:305407:312321:+ [translate_table: standard]